MPLYTQDEIKAEIVVLKIKISKTESAQSYASGANLSLARGDLAAMYERLKHLEKEWAKLDALNNEGNISLVEFGDPS